MKLAVGWDVGAWHCTRSSGSQDALVAIRVADTPERVGQAFRGNLRGRLTANPEKVLANLFDAMGLGGLEVDEVIFAIDATLGWPRAFLELVGEGKMPGEVPMGKRVDNELLTRRTERVVAKKMAGTPLSSVQDRIGSQSTKALALLTLLQLQRSEPGVWTGEVDGTKVVAIETYPALCKRSAQVSSLSALLGPWPKEGSDEADALLCAIVAWLFATERQSLVAPQVTDTVEGWIWHPIDLARVDGKRDEA